MKKLLMLLISFIVVLGFGGCNSTSPEQQAKQTLEDLENIECLIGLNGQLSCYLVVEEEGVLQSVNASEDLDKTKLPSYMLNEFGEYVTVDDIGVGFKLKYFDTSDVHSYDDYYKLRGETKLKFVFEGEMDANEVFAKMVILINELENYEYYFLSSTHVIVEVTWIDMSGYVHKIIIESSSDNLLSDAIVITPESIFDGDMELYYELMDITIDETLVSQYYNDYVTNGTYSGYILNYSK